MATPQAYATPRPWLSEHVAPPPKAGALADGTPRIGQLGLLAECVAHGMLRLDTSREGMGLMAW